MSDTEFFSADLAGVIVGETAISDVQGDSGRLSYRGYSIDTLVGKPFWQVVWLVLFGAYPDAAQETSLRDAMAAHSQLDAKELTLLKSLRRDLHPMLVLQGLVPLLPLTPKVQLPGLSGPAQTGLLLAAKLPTLLAAWRRLELGLEPLAPDVDAGFHENFLTMFNGSKPTAKQVQTLDVTQILQMEHSFNAGTFAGRVCASTLAPIQSSISAAIGTLYGPLHGGADQAAMEMARSIGDASKAAQWVADTLARKQKIMGMGHREYRVVDPRAKILKPMAIELCTDGEAKRLLEVLVAVEAACADEFRKKGKEIWANVEFYKGAVFHQLGIPPHYYTSLFAMARIYGYIAHFLEFSQHSALIRPRARYVGPQH
ncbi:MAG TPA: citrate/2-methylcitrate synthase [Candidatus Acidoferrum sp.]|nr:citrate/2-methylcitrate synthase [Candidatus Acidoferrum sp.]